MQTPLLPAPPPQLRPRSGGGRKGMLVSWGGLCSHFGSRTAIVRYHIYLYQYLHRLSVLPAQVTARAKLSTRKWLMTAAC